jgi:hypothetical protein
VVEGEANHVNSLPGLRNQSQFHQDVVANDVGDLLGRSNGAATAHSRTRTIASSRSSIKSRHVRGGMI